MSRPVARPKSLNSAKPFVLKSRMQGNNDDNVLYLKYIGCKVKHQRAQFSLQRV